jgi:hypothetical protein
MKIKGGVRPAARRARRPRRRLAGRFAGSAAEWAYSAAGKDEE